MNSLADLKNILADTLALGDRKNALQADSVLLGGLAELDSMAVVNVIAAIEDHFGIQVHDDEISGATFATLGSLTAFVDGKLAQ